MELIRGIHNLSPRHRGCIATIGNFDGVHLGHKKILDQVIEKAAEFALPSQVIIFEPLPREYFAGSRAPARLTRFREKVLVLQQHAIDRLLCLRFNRTLARMPPEVFVKRILVDGLAIRFLVVGDDFRFGRDREGNYALLQKAGQNYGFEVTNTHSFMMDGDRVSSTRIRFALQRGDLVTAEKLLGRPYRISGRVMPGDKMGRRIGFPTANIRLARQVSPVQGVFASRVYGLPGDPFDAIVNIGTRPTVGGNENRLEVYILDFEKDIYGIQLHVDLLGKIRDETQFQSIDDLKRQIRQDLSAARNFFANLS